MARTFKLGSIVLKVSRKSLTITTAKAAKAQSRAKGAAARRARFLQHKLNEVRHERERLAETVEASYAKIASLTRELNTAHATARKVKASRSERVNAERAEVFMHRVTEE
jgi:predicted  nucleic acid-binding Zn-ribbon protein